MKPVLCLLAMSLALTLAQPAIAAASCGIGTAPPAPGSEAPAAARAAHDLATLYYPEDMIAAVVERQSRSAFEQGVRESPGGERLVTEHPGLIEAGYAATMRVIRPCISVMVPVLQHRAAELLEQRLSVAHMQGVAEFYRSDAGRATMAAIASSMRPPQLRTLPDGSIAPMTREDLRAALPTDFMRALSPAQVMALQAFAISPHGRAFIAASPSLEQLTVAMVNQMNAGAQAEVEAAVRAAVEDYIRRNYPPRRGS